MPDLAPAKVVAPTTDDGLPIDAPPPQPTAPSRSVSPLAWVSGGLALAGIGVGTYFGLRAFSKNDAATLERPQDVCNAAGIELDRQGRTAATASTVAFAVGGAAALATVGFFVLRGSSPTTPQVAISTLGASVRGAW